MTNAKEVENLKRFSEALGWPDLRKETHTITVSRDPSKVGTTVEWFYSGDFADILLQINKDPWRACVFGIRYRICSGWYEFRVSRSQRVIIQEARRLKEFVARELYISTEARRRLRATYPDFAGWTWTRMQMEKPPVHKLWSE